MPYTTTVHTLVFQIEIVLNTDQQYQLEVYSFGGLHMWATGNIN